ncbi:hypothetical protein EZS27_028172 [termite gut metagenome]|uniref:Uncharacterized protein n=1 Tax=termite gut metagenome TaxID=433724 RepID=A0A5J4QLK0_9ZZZZ
MKQKQIKVKLLRKVMTLLLVFFVSTMANAQSETEVSVGADIVSGYIWRGIDLGGISVQPGITVSRSGLSLTAWGSVGLESKDAKEFDLTLGYTVGGFSAAVTDYWFNTPDNSYFKYAAHSTVHIYEATLGYDFGIFSLSWNTNFAGSDYKENGKRAYSSYAEAAVPFKLGGYDFSAEVGITPWDGAYANKFVLTNIGIGASKEIKVTDSFTIPAFAKVIANPYAEHVYFVFGVSF